MTITAKRQDARATVRRAAGAGFTLVELLVVLGILAALAAIVVPGMARLGFLSRDELKHGALDLQTILKAAQTFAGTYNVETAVVYAPSDWQPCEPAEGELYIGQPAGGIQDSLSGDPERCLIGVSLMIWSKDYNAFVPLTKVEGGFREIAGEMAVLLRDPSNEMVPVLNEPDGIAALGMVKVRVMPNFERGVSDQEGEIEGEGDCALQKDTPWERDYLPAHVFLPSGAMRRTAAPQAKERYTLVIAPRPDVNAEDRQIYPELGDVWNNEGEGQSNLLSAQLYVYRSTGRVQLAD